MTKVPAAPTFAADPIARRPLPPALRVAALLAAILPTLLAHHQPPSATLLNQCLAVALWGGVAAALAPARIRGETLALLAALALTAAAVAASWGWGSLPHSLALQALGLLLAAGVMGVAGADAAGRPSGPAAFAALAWGLLLAGVLSGAVALVQVFAPGWADGNWIASSGLPGRAVGNLRQPNHLCSLLLWALVAAVALHELRRLPRAALWALVPLLVFAVELSASRTGAVGLLLLLLWGLLDRRLSRSTRWLLALTPLLYGLALAAMAWYGQLSQHAIGAAARVAEGGLSDLSAAGGSPNSRLNIARNALALVAANPWTGVGFGEFNFAWSLTAFPGRPTAFFDHTHNLFLQLAVELGLPLAGLVLLLLAVALVQAWRHAARAAGDAAVAGRAALMLVLMIGLHSLVEYPLWYAYFLLPAALAWGFALGTPTTDAAPGRPSAGPVALPGLLAGLAVALGGVLAVLDYQRVVVIYAPPEGSGPLAQRIAAGQRSPLFAHHADYAAATNTVPPDSAALGFTRATHSLLDTRLMIAWAGHLAATGETDRARWLAQRLREFRNPEADEFFAPCDQGAQVAFQCQAPEAVHDWREFAALPPRAAAPVQAGSPARQ
ncbi:MAG: O-antigen ligase C-terminal domain-containing protein [Burkholderiaceae bacterium]|nr:O-antigen ligase C-terminal domain-containing protein [Burkholderiaceae bacterium]